MRTPRSSTLTALSTHVLIGLFGFLLGVGDARAAEWQPAPLFGGEVYSLAFSPTDPAVVLAGTAAGQVWRSDDAGSTWQHAGRVFPLPGWVVEALHFDTNRPERVWAGLRGVWGGGGVVVSDDLGATWEVRHLRPEDTLYSLTTVPGAPGRLFLGTRSGVWRSTDEGLSFREVSAAEPELVEVSSLLVDPTAPRSLLAGTFRRAFRSDDGGDTWRGVFDGMALDSQVFSMHPVPSRPGAVWASTCGWVYHSPDGRRWERFKNGLAERRTPSFQVLPTGRLLAGTVGGVYRSDDGGHTWTVASRGDLSILEIAHHPRRPEIVLVGTEGAGVWRSTDGGASFAPAVQGMTGARVTAVAVDGDSLFVAVAHGGPAAGIYRSSDGGASFVQETGVIPTVLDLALVGRSLFAATENGLWERREGWRPVPGLEGQRVDQVLAVGARVLVRTPAGFRELAGGRVSPVSLPGGGEPQAAAVHDGALWVTTAGRLVRWAGAQATPVASPGGHRLTALGTRLVLSGSGGAWSRASGTDWSRHLEGRSRAVATGDAAYPGLVLGDQRALLLRAADGVFLPLDLPFPARDVLAAGVVGDRLALGTAGYGLVTAPLSALAPAPAGQGGSVAVAGGS